VNPCAFLDSLWWAASLGTFWNTSLLPACQSQALHLGASVCANRV
jgi:hypothetical protein